MDDATSTLYSAFLVEEEGTASTLLRRCWRCSRRMGLPCSLYTDRGSHYFYTAKAGEAVDKDRLTQVGRALERHLGIEHIPAYSPEARGRSERMFATLQDRLVEGAEARRHHRYRDRQPRGCARSICRSTMRASPSLRHVAERPSWPPIPPCCAETLCVEEERVVGRDNTVAYRTLRLQLPESRMRPHYVKARVKVREYPDGSAGDLPRTALHRPLRCRGPPDRRPDPRQAWPRARRRQGVAWKRPRPAHRRRDGQP